LAVKAANNRSIQPLNGQLSLTKLVSNVLHQQCFFFFFFTQIIHIGESGREGGGSSSWRWSYGSYIYNYLCNQSLEFESGSLRDVLDVTLYVRACQRLAAGRWFSPDTPVSSTNKSDGHGIAEILLKVALNIISLPLHNVCDHEQEFHQYRRYDQLPLIAYHWTQKAMPYADGTSDTGFGQTH
jgi:hypothetical protein